MRQCDIYHSVIIEHAGGDGLLVADELKIVQPRGASVLLWPETIGRWAPVRHVPGKGLRLSSG
jgi:hypothetical protein